MELEIFTNNEDFVNRIISSIEITGGHYDVDKKEGMIEGIFKNEGTNHTKPSPITIEVDQHATIKIERITLDDNIFYLEKRVNFAMLCKIYYETATKKTPIRFLFRMNEDELKFINKYFTDFLALLKKYDHFTINQINTSKKRVHATFKTETLDLEVIIDGTNKGVVRYILSHSEEFKKEFKDEKGIYRSYIGFSHLTKDIDYEGDFRKALFVVGLYFFFNKEEEEREQEVKRRKEEEREREREERRRREEEDRIKREKQKEEEARKEEFKDKFLFIGRDSLSFEERYFIGKHDDLWDKERIAELLPHLTSFTPVKDELETKKGDYSYEGFRMDTEYLIATISGNVEKYDEYEREYISSEKPLFMIDFKMKELFSRLKNPESVVQIKEVLSLLGCTIGVKGSYLPEDNQLVYHDEGAGGITINSREEMIERMHDVFYFDLSATLNGDLKSLVDKLKNVEWDVMSDKALSYLLTLKDKTGAYPLLVMRVSSKMTLYAPFYLDSDLFKQQSEALSRLWDKKILFINQFYET